MKIKDRIRELRRVKASELIPHPKNWRTHPDGQADALRGVLSEIGWADALLARETPEGLALIDGHLRGDLAGDEEVPVLVLDVTAEEAEKLLVTLDPLAGMAEADPQVLGELLASMETGSKALQEMLDGLAAEHGIDLCEPGAEELQDPEPQIDRAAELQEEWGTETGQLWEIPGKAGVHRLLCGDSTKREDVERVMGGARAGLMATDPPYGVAVAGGTHDPRDEKNYRSGGSVANDDLTGDRLRQFLAAAFAASALHLAGGASWYVWYAGTETRAVLEACEVLGGMRHILVWVKPNFVFGRSDYHYRHEPVAYGWTPGAAHQWHGSRDQDSVWEHGRDDVAKKMHPTLKPAALFCQPILNHTRKSDTILDPFLGSGTTMVAAEQLSRVCHGIEIAPQYVAVVLQRMKDHGLKPKLAEAVTA